jgi:predicted AAA+ superfamily ATPase
MAGVNEKILLDKNQIIIEFKGAMTEQFVCQELKMKYDLFYWSAESASSELDVVIQKDSLIIPVEVKAEENLKAKSLKVYVEKFNPDEAVRTSMSFYRKEDWLVNLPLYAIFTL